MQATLKKPPAYDEANTAVSSAPEVQKAKAEFDAAEKVYKEIRARVDELDLLCKPAHDTSSTSGTPPSRLTVLHAQASLPGQRLKLFEAEMALEAARATHEQLMSKAVLALMEARVEARKALIAELITVLHEARQVAREIADYDETTQKLGGQPPLCPFAELVSDRYREDIVTFGEERLRREGWL